MDENAEKVKKGLQTIKDKMPQTYAAIQEQAAGPRGKDAYSLVRRSLRGEADCFYAIEGGHVMGTPFLPCEATDEIARHMLQFGCGFLIVWPMA